MAYANVGAGIISLGPRVFGSNESDVAQTKTAGEMSSGSYQVGGPMGTKPNIIPFKGTSTHQDPLTSKALKT